MSRRAFKTTCVDCGREIIARSRGKLRCDECNKLRSKQAHIAYRARMREGKRKLECSQLYPKSSIRDVLRKLEEYNKANRKKLSYGQFVVLMEKGAV